MDPDKVDLSPMDPAADHESWDRLVAAIARQGFEARRRQLSVSRTLAAWVRPAAIMAAAAAVAVLIISAGGPARPGKVVPTTAEPANLMMAWASSDELPPAAAILSALGGNHEQD